MLAAQSYDGRPSVHDDAMANRLGFKAGTIEGPTHLSQFVPLCLAVWGTPWLETGRLSVHFRNPVFDGDQVRAMLFGPRAADDQAEIRMEKRDGTEVLVGTASTGASHGASALDLQMKNLAPFPDRVLLKDIRLGDRTPRHRVCMALNQTMGAVYPFSLAEKLDTITEMSDLYVNGAGLFERAIIPFEMISVLSQYRDREFPIPVRGPSLGLFADQEIRLIKGPLFVGQAYDIDREIVAFSSGKRTESVWIKTYIYTEGTDEVLATLLLNFASFKDTYDRYASEYAKLYGD
jgi:hypothetical protein